MKKTNDISLEIARRTNDKESDSIIGNELRMHRLDKQITLSGLSKNTCSTSYLSKVETNQIIPNKIFLSEICNKLSLDDKNMDALCNSKENVKIAINAFLKENTDIIKSIVKENEGLISYRIKIVDFIYFLSIRNLVKSSRLYEILIKNIKSMGDYDLIVFALFSGVFHFYTEHFDEAKKELSSINNLVSDKDIILLRDLFIFYVNLKQSKVDAVIDYDNLYRSLAERGLYKLMEQISYYLGCYYAKFSLERGYNKIIDRITNKTYLNTLKFLFTYFSENKIITDMDEVSMFAKAIININKNKGYVANILKAKVGKVELDFDYYYIEYLLMDSSKKSGEIMKYFAPIIEVTKDEFLITYFYNEMVRYCGKEGRYKRISDFHNIINKTRNNYK